MILLNFKIYEEGFGDGAIKLAKVCQEVAESTKIEIIPVVSALDAYRIKQETGLKVFLQNIDSFFEGAHTGAISPLQAQALGIRGALINHSENRKKPGTIRSLLKVLPADFESVVCIQSMGQTDTWAKSLPTNIIAYEPSYLIGSKDKSVATEKADVVGKIVEKYPDKSILVGAGIKSKKDVEISVKLGAKGILISSAVVKSQDPKKVLLELAEAFI